MIIVNQDLEMVAIFNKDGEPKPIRFRITDENGEQQVYKIERIMSKEKQRIEKAVMWVYNCFIIMNGSKRLCEIRYYLSNTTWKLHKI